MFPKFEKIIKVSATELDKINEYISDGAYVISVDTAPTSEVSAETSYFYLGLTNSAK
ncbi:MAG: hypothetical protein ACI4VC_04270 [Clostridia bacterium]